MQRWIITVLILASAGSVRAQSSVWDLQVGDQFSIETTIEQETTLRIGDTESNVEHSTERLVVQYRVNSVRPDETIISVRIAEAEATSTADVVGSETTQMRAGRLTGVPMLITVNADGVVESLENFDAVLEQSASAHERAVSLLKQSVSQDSFASWISLPFWVTPPVKPAEDGASWERIHEVSLGMLGRIRNILAMKSNDAHGNTQLVSVAANSRHVPIPPPTQAAQPGLTFVDASAELTAFQGTAQLIKVDVSDESDAASEESPIQNDRRPWFESLQMEWKLTGQATVKARSESFELAFQQNHKQTSKLLPGFQMRAPLPLPFGDVPPQN